MKKTLKLETQTPSFHKWSQLIIPHLLNNRLDTLRSKVNGELSEYIKHSIMKNTLKKKSGPCVSN